MPEEQSHVMVGDTQELIPRRDRLKQLRAFCQAARLGSISRAAERVMSSQPAVSTQIRTLEEELGVQLFERRGPRIVLSRIGRMLYHRAMPLVEGMDRLPDTFFEEQHGVAPDYLLIGAGQVSAAYVLPEFLKRFRASNPRVRVRVKTGTGRQRLDWLRNYELDLVVAAMDSSAPDLEFHPVLESEFVLITSEDHPLAGRDSVGFEEASAYPFIWHAADHYTRQAAEVIMRLHGIIAPEVAVEVNGWGVITNYVAAGAGIAVVPDVCLTDHDRLRKIRFPDILPRRKYGAVTRRRGPVSLCARRLLEIMAAGEQDAAGEH